MNWEAIKRKITSRKLWMAIAGFVSGLMVAFDIDAETAETVSGLILQAASVVGYIVAEGLADAAHTGEDHTAE
jgi:phage shock protein PspC (stress-responsive transcriptional regulator)